MDYISMIFLAALFVMQTATLALFFLEKRRNNRRYTAMLDYIDRASEYAFDSYEADTERKFQIYENKFRDQLKFAGMDTDKLMEQFKTDIRSDLSAMREQMENKLSGMVLDFQQAQEAASKINDFGASLASIFDYDPMQAIRKGRTKEVC